MHINQVLLMEKKQNKIWPVHYHCLYLTLSKIGSGWEWKEYHTHCQGFKVFQKLKIIPKSQPIQCK